MVCRSPAALPRSSVAATRLPMADDDFFPATDRVGCHVDAGGAGRNWQYIDAFAPPRWAVPRGNQALSTTTLGYPNLTLLVSVLVSAFFLLATKIRFEESLPNTLKKPLVIK